MPNKMLNKLIVLISLFFISQSTFASNPQVRIVTNKGNIEIALNQQKAPKSVKNFLRYVNSGHYNNTVFHRVIKGFMIQGGGFDTRFQRKNTEQAIVNEADNGLRNDRGTIAMARTNVPHSATAQFFINTANNDSLNHTGKTMRGWGYAVFGKVTKGMNVVDTIENSKTGAKAPFSRDAPVEDVIIQKIEIISE